MQPKEHFIKKLELLIDFSKPVKMLELGSGESWAVLPLLKKFPELHYVGVEPNRKDAERARSVLKNFKNARICNQLAYEKINNEDDFDICISLSVLEHIKQLEKFLITSIRSVRSGGLIIHRYDLGHALYPNSLKEKLHIFLGNYFPHVLPETRFVRYIDEKHVCDILKRNGAKIHNITYHQMPNHKAFLKCFNADTAEKAQLAEDILEWEYAISKYVHAIEQKQRGLLFPTMCIWATKQ